MFETPWKKPNRDECTFYTTMKYPDGETIEADWTIPNFNSYIGGYNINGKTVLDVGTASGYIAFNAEKYGAKQVTGLDMATADEYCGVPHAQAPDYQDRAHFRSYYTEHLKSLKNSWWYSWYKFNSNARCIYKPHKEFFDWDETFDVVIAGAIVEHLSDPVSAISAWTKVAKEAVILPLTNVINDEEQFMHTVTPWQFSDPNKNYSWWVLSSGLYKRIFDNLGFDITYKRTIAFHNPDGGIKVRRPTIIARRR